MRQRAPIVLSATALVVAVLGATPFGQAAVTDLTAKFPPFARTSAFAKLAGDSKKLNGHKSTLRGLPGTIPVVGSNGKLPVSIGAVGPQGPQGSAGPKGDRGPAGPTFGAATQVGNPNSYTNMADIGTAVTVKFDTPGTLFAFGRVELAMSCTPNQECSRHYGLYVDGDPVMGSLAEVFGISAVGTKTNVTVFGTKTVGAGTHTIRLRAGSSANVTSFLDVLPNVGGIVLGNS